jgi:transketolase C-terminal domain/subunit
MDNHYLIGGQGDRLADCFASGIINGKTLKRIAINEVPVSGNNAEVLAHHELDSKGIVRILVDEFLS